MPGLLHPDGDVILCGHAEARSKARPPLSPALWDLLPEVKGMQTGSLEELAGRVVAETRCRGALVVLNAECLPVPQTLHLRCRISPPVAAFPQAAEAGRGLWPTCLIGLL